MAQPANPYTKSSQNNAQEFIRVRLHTTGNKTVVDIAVLHGTHLNSCDDGVDRDGFNLNRCLSLCKHSTKWHKTTRR